ncbi:HlyD family efflux transporter periplasmic adaptor subunit [Herbiconiux sp. A18JL235]|uniref:HlyD family efflux transporter periplasmic adaptor subunit n=1 Tax=Herbiconiux sp. A18JL235 TaxID=3152363 RepID=A0AB39BHU1_9MICO
MRKPGERGSRWRKADRGVAAAPPIATGADDPAKGSSNLLTASEVPAKQPTPPSAKKATARRRRNRRVVAVLTATAVLCAVGGGAAFALSQGSGGNYRTATAELGTVDETLALSGTVASVSRSDTSFQVGGTVNGVSVSVGDTVAAGQRLATLDTSDLQDAVDEAQEAVTAAEEQLASDLEAQSSGSTSSSTSAGGSAETGVSGDAAAGAAGDAPSGAGGSSGATPSGGTGGGSDSGSSGGAGSGGSTFDSAAIDTAVAAVKAAQQALLDQYATARAATDATQETIASSDTACRPFLEATIDDIVAGGGTGSSDGESDAGDDASDDDADAGAGTGGDAGTADGSAALDAIKSDLAACQTAIGEVQTEQVAVQAAQSTLLDLMTALDDAVARLQTAVAAAVAAAGSADGSSSGSAGSDGASATATPAPTSTSTPTPTASAEPTPQAAPAAATASRSGSASAAATTTVALVAAVDTGSSSGAAAASGGGTSGTGTTGTITAETIVADQAEIEVAKSDLAIAQQQLTLAALTSPIAGMVAAVSLAVGDTVTAASTSAAITVLGDDGYLVSTTVTLANVPKLAVGQTASVPLASGEGDMPLTGVVSSIGVLDVSTDSSTPSYDVVIALDPTDQTLLTGASAQVEVAVASQASVLTVPTSAVHRSGTDYTVDLLVGGTSQPTPVEVGAMGAERTEITSGVSEGDVVVLADLDSDVLDSDSETGTSGLSGLGGSSTAGTVPSGGFPGGTSGFPAGPPTQ